MPPRSSGCGRGSCTHIRWRSTPGRRPAPRTYPVLPPSSPAHVEHDHRGFSRGRTEGSGEGARHRVRAGVEVEEALRGLAGRQGAVSERLVVQIVPDALIRGNSVGAVDQSRDDSDPEQTEAPGEVAAYGGVLVAV